MWEAKNSPEDYRYWKIENKKIRILFWSIFILSIIYIFYPRFIGNMLPVVDETSNSEMVVRVFYEKGEENIIINDKEIIKKILNEIRPYKGRVAFKKRINTTGQKSFQLTLVKKNSISTIDIIGKQYIQIIDNENNKMFKLYGEGFNSEDLLRILKEETNLNNYKWKIFSPSDAEVSGIEIDMTKDALIKKLGEPNKIEHKHEAAFGDLDVLNYYYEFGHIRLEPMDIKRYSVGAITIIKSTIKGPRDIKVGDSIEDVLKKFPLNNKVVVNKDNITNKNSIKYIYGGPGENSGYITYDELGKIKSVTYDYGGGGFGAYTLNIDIQNDKVTSIHIDVMNV